MKWRDWAPDEISEVFGEPFTNYTAMLAVGSMTYLLSPIPEHYSIMAGTFDSEGMPTGFQYGPDEVWFDFVSNWSPYEPLLMEMETEWAVCGDPAHPVPFFDHLGDITVPVMYLGGQGGFGEEGEQLQLLGSTRFPALWCPSTMIRSWTSLTPICSLPKMLGMLCGDRFCDGSGITDPPGRGVFLNNAEPRHCRGSASIELQGG